MIRRLFLLYFSIKKALIVIPKRIFYVWSAFEPKKRDVLACMQSWYMLCSDYEIIEINEKSNQYFNFQEELKNNKWFHTVFKKQMWAYVADYIRIKVLYDNGGIYLDTDVSVLKNFDRFLFDPAFVGIQDNAIDGKFDNVEPAILGSKKSNSILESLLKIYEKDIWEMPIYSMPDLFRYVLKKTYKDDMQAFKEKKRQTVVKYPDIFIYPEGVFIPFRYGENFSQSCITSQTHTIHWWGASWIKRDVLFFLKNKHKLPLERFKADGRYFLYIMLFCIFPILKLLICNGEIKIANFTK